MANERRQQLQRVLAAQPRTLRISVCKSAPKPSDKHPGWMWQSPTEILAHPEALPLIQRSLGPDLQLCTTTAAAYLLAAAVGDLPAGTIIAGVVVRCPYRDRWPISGHVMLTSPTQEMVVPLESIQPTAPETRPAAV